MFIEFILYTFLVLVAVAISFLLAWDLGAFEEEPEKDPLDDCSCSAM
jgi:hypothetical protein